MDELIEIRAKLEVLRQENAGLQAAVTALAAALCRVNDEAERRTKTLLALTIAEEDVFTEPPRGFPARAIFERLCSITQDGVDPERVIASRLLLAADAGTDRLPALRQWMSQASADELGEDILEALRRTVQRGDQQGGGG